MIEQVIEVVGTLLGIWIIGTFAWMGLIAWASWYSPDFHKTETRQPKTYITIIVLGLAIYIAFF